MKTYNNFNEMYNTESNTTHSIFNITVESDFGDYNGEVDGSGYPIGCFDVVPLVTGNPYLSVHFYGDSDIQNNNLMREDSGGFVGITFDPTSELDDGADNDDLIVTLMDVIGESSDRSMKDVSPDNAIDFDWPLSRDEAMLLASKLDGYIEMYIKKHNL